MVDFAEQIKKTLEENKQKITDAELLKQQAAQIEAHRCYDVAKNTTIKWMKETINENLNLNLILASMKSSGNPYWQAMIYGPILFKDDRACKIIEDKIHDFAKDKSLPLAAHLKVLEDAGFKWHFCRDMWETGRYTDYSDYEYGSWNLYVSIGDVPDDKKIRVKGWNL